MLHTVLVERMVNECVIGCGGCCCARGTMELRSTVLRATLSALRSGQLEVLGFCMFLC
jgi:hypothetical protein